MVKSKRYIRNSDIHLFNKGQVASGNGVLLTEYYGTIKEAMEKGVPLFGHSGKKIILTHTPPKKYQQSKDKPRKK
jgi:hypothetical protein